MKRDPKSLWPETYLGRWMAEDYEPDLVSVIIPTYNRSALVLDAMDSVLAQTYRPIELLVVDDGSTDGTREAIETWRQKCAADATIRLRYLHQENHGVSAARNYGLVESRGQFIQYLDSDDLLLPHKLATQVPVLATGTADYVYGVSRFLDPAGRETTRTLGQKYHNYRGAKPFITMAVWMVNAVLYRRAVCKAIGPWNEDLIGNEDQEYAARVKASEFRGKFLEDNNNIVRSQHAFGQATLPRGSDPMRRYAESVEKALQRVRLILEHYDVENPSEWYYLARTIAGLGGQYAQLGSRRDVLRCLRLAQAWAPRGRQKFAFALLRGMCCVLPLRAFIRVKGVAARALRPLISPYLGHGELEA
jgi:glycosyltransferase involved in cell wall biosynthesis